MAIDSTAFDRYRRSPTAKTTLPRLALGTLVVVLVWFAATAAALVVGTYLYVRSGAAAGPKGFVETFMATPTGVIVTLLSFAGIWLGLWIAMRWIHREALSSLIGNSRRIVWPSLLKGLAAVLITSALSELLLYALHPGIERAPVAWSTWLVVLVPMVLLVFLQTSSEEMLFRGYLLRALAFRFRSPLVWAQLPLFVFTVLHWSAASSSLNAAVLVSIGAFAVLLTVLVYATGNLSAAFGAHLGNNLTSFLFISHQDGLGAFALFSGLPVDAPGWSGHDAMLIAAIGIGCTALTALLLLHRRSPLKVEPDLGPPEPRQA